MSSHKQFTTQIGIGFRIQPEEFSLKKRRLVCSDLNTNVHQWTALNCPGLSTLLCFLLLLGLGTQIICNSSLACM